MAGLQVYGPYHDSDARGPWFKFLGPAGVNQGRIRLVQHLEDLGQLKTDLGLGRVLGQRTPQEGPALLQLLSLEIQTRQAVQYLGASRPDRQGLLISGDGFAQPALVRQRLRSLGQAKQIRCPGACSQYHQCD